MRTLLTALAFLVILMAVIPAVKRSISPPRLGAGVDKNDRTT